MARPRSISDEKILEVARRCFLEHGPGVSTQVVADALGISQPALFRRFGTKEDLLMAALIPKAPPFLGLLTTGPTAGPFEPQLKALMGSIADFFWEMIPCVSILRASGIDAFAQMHKTGDPPPILTHKALVSWLKRAVELKHIRGGDVETLAAMILGSLQFRPFLGHLDKDYLPDITRERYLEGLTHILMAALNRDEPTTLESR